MSTSIRSNGTVVQHLVDAEEKLVGSLFCDPIYAVPAIRDEITPEDFDNQVLGAILREGIALYDETGSVLTFALAQRLNLNAVGGVAYLDRLEDGVASAKNVLAYVGPIREAAYRRKTEALLKDAVKRVQSGEKVSPQLQSQVTAALSGNEIAGQPRRKLKLTLASSIDPKPARWIWEDDDGGRIPVGEITMTVGGGGIGKSTAHAWFVARVTLGELPGIHYGMPKSAIICASEDSWARTIVPRLMAAGADMDRVLRVEVEEHGEAMRLTLPVDLDALAVVIREYDVAIVSLDPLMTLIGAKLDTYKDHEVRRALEPLASLADDTGVSILGNGHFNKSQTGDLLSRITGSAAFGQVVRAVLAFAKDEEADFVVSQAKNNLGLTNLPHLAYRIENAEISTAEGSASVGKLEWCGQSERSVTDLLRPERKNASSEQEGAVAWLQEPEVLGKGQERPAREIYDAAEAEEITTRTLQRAAREVCAKRREGFGGPVWWKLKDTIPAHTRHPVGTGDNAQNVASMSGATVVEGVL